MLIMRNQAAAAATTTAAFPVRSVESPLSVKNCSVKASVECQPSVLRIDESLSPASFDSVVIPERDSRGGEFNASTSPINNSVECLEADQVKSFFFYFKFSHITLHY